MKIHIHSGSVKICVILPTGLLFCKGAIKLGLRIGRAYTEQVPDISPEAIDILCDEIKRIKKQYGVWELANIRSADGTYIQITL